MNKIWETYKLPLVIGGLSLFSIILSIVLLFKSTQTTTPIQFSRSSDEASDSGQASVLKVDIEGAVLNPGVFTLPSGARVEDAIVAAGGLSKDVDDEILAKTVNRAMKLVDGGKIFIPSLSSPQSPQVPLSPLVSVNSGTQSDLESLPGVGPATAKKIIDSRPYQTIEELVSKKAVGTALFEKIKAQVSL